MVYYWANILTFICLVLMTLTSESESSRILAVFPTPSFSHQVVFRSLMQELARRGHEVVVVTPNPAFPKGQAPPNLIEIDLQNKSYGSVNSLNRTASGIKSDYVNQMKKIYETASNIVETQFKFSEVQRLVNNKQQTFDLLFLELFPRINLGYTYIYNLPVIQFSSFGGMRGTFDVMGAPSHYQVYPAASCQKCRNPNIWEKIFELYNYCAIYLFYVSTENLDDFKLKRSFDQNIPKISELRDNVNILFLNSHPLWDFNRPISKNIIRLHGIHQNPEKAIPKELENFIRNSTHGVIYMSFGTNSLPSTLPKEKIEIFTKVFSQLPYDVLLKWDKEHLPNCPNNVKVFKWLPQSDILRQGNIKLFITQGGLQSSNETIFAGVPIVAIPLSADQWYNAEMYEIYNIGLKLDMETLTYEVFKNAVESVINDPSYKDNILRLRSIMQDHAQTALERAVWWTEHVLQHGSAHLRPPAANMSWTEYYEIELLFIVILIVIFASIATLKLTGYLMSQIKSIIRRSGYKVLGKIN